MTDVPPAVVARLDLPVDAYVVRRDLALYAVSRHPGGWRRR